MPNPEISKIQLPSGNTYDIKDAVARQMIAGGVSFIIAWNGTSTPTVANIPEGVVIRYNDTNYTGTLEASAETIGKFYLVKSSTNIGTLDVYDEYTTIEIGDGYAWEKIGDTQLDLSSLGELAYKDTVTLSKGSGTKVLGTGTTFANGSSTVSFTSHTTKSAIGANATFSVTQPTITVTPSTTKIKATASGGTVGADGTAAAITGFGAHTTKSALGSSATFTTSVTPTTTNIKATASGTAVGANGTAAAITGFGAHTTDTALGTGATFTTTVTPTTHTITAEASGTAVGANGTDTFVKSYPGATSKLVTTTVPNVTSAGSASTWSFTMGSGNNAETLIISGGNSTAPTLGTAKTVATGGLDANGGGSSVMTGLGTATTASALTGVKVTSQPSVVLVSDGGAGAVDGIDIVTGITSASTSVNSSDTVTAITALGTPTTSNCLTGVKVTTQPSISLATGATAGTGVISVATGITSASTSVNDADTVSAITALGTPTTANALTGVKVTAQPTVTLSTGSTGDVTIATGISSASASGGAVAFDSKDSVSAITALGTGTAAAQTITVTKSEVTVAQYSDLSVTTS